MAGTTNAAEICPYCSSMPWEWGIWGDIIVEQCKALKQSGAPPNALRFHAYCAYTSLKYGAGTLGMNIQMNLGPEMNLCPDVNI